MSEKKKILLEDWQEIKPYGKTSSSDLYYLEICNGIQDQLYEKNFVLPLRDFIREEGISLFCIFFDLLFRRYYFGV